MTRRELESSVNDLGITWLRVKHLMEGNLTRSGVELKIVLYVEISKFVMAQTACDGKEPRM